MTIEEIPKHRKKKQSSTSKSSIKSKHKHEYKEYLLIKEDRPYRATVCKICGKINNIHFMETKRMEDGRLIIIHGEEVYEKYKYLEKIEIYDIWQKYVLVSQEGSG